MAKTKLKSGRAKGKVGEREVAKLHEVWWGSHEAGAQFKSTPQSGGFSTPEVRAHFKMAGDLMTTAKLFPFVIEVKRRESFNMHNLYAANPSPVWEWWDQAVRAARVQGGVPILWFRKKRGEWLLFLPRSLFAHLPRLDAWPEDWKLYAECPPIFTTWDVLRAMPIPAIIKACREFVLPPPLNKPTSLPSSTSDRTLNRRSKKLIEQGLEVNISNLGLTAGQASELSSARSSSAPSKPSARKRASRSTPSPTSSTRPAR